MSTETVFFRLEDKGDSIKVEVQGTGEELINLLAQAISSSDDIKQIIEMSFLAMMVREQETQNEDESIADFLSKMKMGEA